MDMQTYHGKKVGVIGAARQGLATAKYLALHGSNVVLNDQCSKEQLVIPQENFSGLPIEWIFGGHPLSLLDGLDILCLSGGVPLDLPLVKEAINRGIPLTNDSQIFMELVSCPVIGITGSAGKTTTTTLVGRIAQAYQEQEETIQKVYIGGNIGTPLILFLEDIKSNDLVVVELSSFQLELMTISPAIAVILNITPNHLDRHKTMEAYTSAKAKIVEFQRKNDQAILNRDDKGSWAFHHKVNGQVLSFGIGDLPPNGVGTYLDRNNLMLKNNAQEKCLFSKDTISLRGDHNLANILAACAIAYAAGFSTESMKAGVEGFNGVDHRIQFVRNWGGADWYNDSIATAPERTVAALNSFYEPIVLLLGGRDKNLPWEELVSLIRQRVDHLILFGDARNMIANKVEQQITRPNDRLQSLDICKNMHLALEKAAQIVQQGDVVLLSPGCTSFDEFTDFEERGEYFIKWVTELH
jgi:UDP-N-acetylmuramoylalanine--D-glutamate ligase